MAVPKARSTKPPAREVAAKTGSVKAAVPKARSAKAAVPKVRSVKAAVPKAGSAKFPFPFLGEGAAGYFEWGEILVWFVEPVPVRARGAVKRAIPAPFRGSVTWQGPVLYAGNGDQFIQFHITQAYAGLAGEADDDDEDDDDEGFGDLRDIYASGAQLEQFERDIASWLLALHEVHPIAFVARREDSEAGGTRLGAWHRWSVRPEVVADLIPALLTRVDERDTTCAYAIEVVRGLLEDSAPAVFKALPAKIRGRPTRA